ncbi:LuxR family transcriptional regulator [Micromonospora sp. HUAS LYJ1]|uniref:helix-turn-helix transcriptional regulator n=1 Tax=Micromonospora sp. HUAS LYJ1 TaxID=3061626 RepID=UPI0026723B82|nr:LuxR family transcriptional regulator [Micromonospora sp. HUAS LYJ1]WKU05705.1 AAA family ATPase [Micromonospora sp. HUAS LYJ1]
MLSRHQLALLADPAPDDGRHRTPPPHDRPELIGRSAERELLDALLGGRARLPALLFSGEIGVGKTALLRATDEQARRAGRRVVWVTGAPAEADLPYSGLHQLLYSLRADLDRLPTHQRVTLSRILGHADGPTPDRLATCAATLALVTELADDGGLVVLVDDAQWIDRESTDLFAFVARRTCDLAGLVLVAAARQPGPPLTAGPYGRQLAPLPDHDAGQLIDAWHPTLHSRVRRVILDNARGNPLALIELPRALSQEQRCASMPLPAHLPVTPTISGHFGARIRDLPESARQLLLIAALDGRAQLATLTEATDGTDVTAQLGPAERHHLVTLGTDRLLFTHPLVRLTTIDLATRAELRTAHRHLARVTTADQDVRATHLAAAALGPDDALADALAAAGDRAADRGVLTTATEMFARAAELSTAPADRAERLAIAAQLACRAGWLQWAKQLTPAPKEFGVTTHTAAVSAYLLSLDEGDVDLAHRRLLRVFDDPSTSVPMRRMALEMLFHVCVLADRPDHWAALDTVLARPDCESADIVLRCRAILSGRDGDAATMRERFLELLDRWPTTPAELTALSTASLSATAAALDAVTELLPVLRGLPDASADNRGAPTARFGLHMEILDRYHSGRWDETETLLRESATAAGVSGLRTLEGISRCQRALLAAVRGETEQALELTDEVLRWAAPRGIGLAVTLAHQARALVALGTGDHEHAYATLSTIAPGGAVTRLPVSARHIVFDLADAAVHTGHGPQATAYLQALRDGGFDRLSPRMTMLTHGAAALLARDSHTDEAFRQALTAPGHERWPLEHARIRLAYGERLRRAKEIGPARVELGAALEVLDRLGARPWAARARNELRAAGLAVARPAEGPAGLTAQEESVARLAAQGLTNKQIAVRLRLSDRTVSGHLYKVYPKLGVTSRTGLRDALEIRAGWDADGTAD